MEKDQQVLFPLQYLSETRDGQYEGEKQHLDKKNSPGAGLMKN